MLCSPASFPFVMLAICVSAYGLLVPWLGFYSDDWIFVWAFNKMGPEGLTRYFATNRPFLGILMRLTMPIVGIEPWRWQVFALLVRWLKPSQKFYFYATLAERIEHMVAAAVDLAQKGNPGCMGSHPDLHLPGSGQPTSCTDGKSSLPGPDPALQLVCVKYPGDQESRKILALYPSGIGRQPGKPAGSRLFFCAGAAEDPHLAIYP